MRLTTSTLEDGKLTFSFFQHSSEPLRGYLREPSSGRSGVFSHVVHITNFPYSTGNKSDTAPTLNSLNKRDYPIFIELKRIPMTVARDAIRPTGNTSGYNFLSFFNYFNTLTS